jgi:hypothetical protein
MEQIGSEYNFNTGGSIKALNDLIVKVGELDKQVNKLNTDTKTTGDGLNNLPNKTKKASSGFDALGNSINQVTREFPAFAFSAQTGFLAVSNNIPILIDSINQLKTANAALAAEGKATIPVFKQIISSLFSWQTALSLLISFSVLYGKELGNLFSEFIKGKVSIDDVTESIQLYYKAFKGTEVQDAISNIEKLKINVELASSGFLRKEQVVKQYNETIGKTTGQLKDLSEIESFLVNGADAYIKMTLYKAAANLSLEESAKSLIEVQKDVATSLDVTLINARYDEALRIARENIKDKKELAKEEMQIESLRQDEINKFAEKSNFDSVKRQKQQLDIAKKFMTDAAKISNQFNFDLLGSKEDTDKAAKELLAKQKKLLEERVQGELNAAQEVYIKSISIQGATIQDKENAEIKLLEAQIAIFEKYKKADKQYAQDSLDTREKLAEKILNINKKLIDKMSDDKAKADKEDNERNEKLMQESLGFQLLDSQKHFSELKKGKEKNSKELLQIAIDEAKAQLDILKKFETQDLKSQQDLFAAKKKLSDAEIDLEQYEAKEKEIINEAVKNKLIQIGESTVQSLYTFRTNSNNIETENEIKNAEDLFNKKEITEQQFNRKKRAALNEQARTQRKIDLAQIQINTALSIAKTFAQFGYPAGIPLAVLAALEGAIQYSFASAQPLPQFAKGTDRVMGGRKGIDSVHALLMPDEAVIPTKQNLARPNLAKDWIDGNLDRHIAMNYIRPAIEENNRKWEATLKVNQSSTFIRNDNFNDKNIVKQLVKSNRINQRLINNLAEGKTNKRNNRLWN